MPVIILSILDEIKNNKYVQILLGVFVALMICLFTLHEFHSKHEIENELKQEQISNSILLQEQQKDNALIDQYHSEMESNLAKTDEVIKSTTKTLDANKKWSNTPIPSDLAKELN